MAARVSKPTRKSRRNLLGRLVARYEWRERSGVCVAVAKYVVVRVPLKPTAANVRAWHRAGRSIRDLQSLTGYSQQHVWRLLHGKRSGRE